MSIEPNAIVIYRPENSTIALEIAADPEHRTIWATQRQIAELLDLTAPTVNHHIQSFKEQRGEKADRSIRKFRIVAEDGKVREVEHYDLTVITFVGFRAQASERVLAFQDWAGEMLDRMVAGRQPELPVELTLGQRFMLMAQHMVEQEQINTEHDQRITQLEAVTHVNQEYFTVVGYYNLKGLGKLSDIEARAIGRKAGKLSRERGIPPQKVNTSQWGPINAYHISILDEVTADNE